jgi:serine protease Do
MSLERTFSFLMIALVSLVAPATACARDLPDFTGLVETNAPAVVNIGIKVRNNGNGGAPVPFNLPDVPEDNPFHDFFRRFFGDMPPGPGGTPEPSNSLGSGFIVSPDGYVISNFHVVKDAEEVTVKLADRREFPAKVVGTDERSDIAVLKIEARDLPTLRMGRSADLKVGEWVLAIGSPFGFEHTVTAGIVSAKGRALPNESYIPFIQTDVAINPGNSGGPLFNLDGEVVGVNSQIYSRTGGFMGLSFAVPIDVVMGVYEQIKTGGTVKRGWLGVLIQDVTRELAESFRMSKPAGALVSKVLPDSPAAAAGLEAGDVITRFNGKEIGLSSELPPLVGTAPVGKKAPVEVIRNGKRLTLQVPVGELPPPEAVSLAGPSTTRPDDARNSRLGLTVADLTDAQREEAELQDHGVLVTEVAEGPALAAGLTPGDIILLVDNQKVATVKAFAEIASTLPAGKSVPILIQRRGGPLFLALKLP